MLTPLMALTNAYSDETIFIERVMKCLSDPLGGLNSIVIVGLILTFSGQNARNIIAKDKQQERGLHSI